VPVVDFKRFSGIMCKNVVIFLRAFHSRYTLLPRLFGFVANLESWIILGLGEGLSMGIFNRSLDQLRGINRATVERSN